MSVTRDKRTRWGRSSGVSTQRDPGDRRRKGTAAGIRAEAYELHDTLGSGIAVICEVCARDWGAWPP